MKEHQEEFLSALKKKEKLTVAEYATLLSKYSELAIEAEKKGGAEENEAKTMGNYYTISVLSDFIRNENILSRVIAMQEASQSS